MDKVRKEYSGYMIEDLFLTKIDQNNASSLPGSLCSWKMDRLWNVQ